MKRIIVPLAVVAAMTSLPLFAELCEKCRDGIYTQDIGKCTACGGSTSSGAFKLCDKCSLEKHQCQHCLVQLTADKNPPDDKDADKAAAGSSSRRKPNAVEVTEADRGKTVQTTVSKTIGVSLKGNPTTGFQWQVDSVKGDAVVQDGKIEYIQAKHAPGMVGVGGVFVARFKAAKAGKTELKLVYVRPWEKETPPAKTFDVTIDVKP